MAKTVTRPGPPPAESTVRVLAFWAFTLLALALAASGVLTPVYASVRDAEQRIEFIRGANRHIEEGNARLAAQIDAAQSDPFYAERIIRVDLRCRRPGERVVALSPHPHREPDLADWRASGVEPATWWQARLLRMAAEGRKRAFTLGAAGVLLLVALVCFADPRPSR